MSYCLHCLQLFTVSYNVLHFYARLVVLTVYGNGWQTVLTAYGNGWQTVLQFIGLCWGLCWSSSQESSPHRLWKWLRLNDESTLVALRTTIGLL
jgi:hypothetical protein